MVRQPSGKNDDALAMVTTTRRGQPDFATRSPGRRAGGHVLSDRLRTWAWKGRRTAVAFVLAGAIFVSGPAASATGNAAAPTQVRSGASAPRDTTADDTEAALGARLAMGYAGAVPSTQVRVLVHRVITELIRDASPPARLLQTAEAVCRRELTDHLARGLRRDWEEGRASTG